MIYVVKEYPVRYGRTYKVVLALILPGLLTIPFIYSMAGFKEMEDWKIWCLIYLFLGITIGLSIWLALNIYPRATLKVSDFDISIEFNHSNLLAPSDFSFAIADIDKFKKGSIGTDDYYIFVTRNPYRKFQISAATREMDDLLSFYKTMNEINEMVTKATVIKDNSFL